MRLITKNIILIIILKYCFLVCLFYPVSSIAQEQITPNQTPEATLNQAEQKALGEEQEEPEASFADLLLQFKDSSYSEKSAIVEVLSTLDDNRVLPVLNALNDARLYIISRPIHPKKTNESIDQNESSSLSTDEIVITTESPEGFIATSVLLDESLGLLDQFTNEKIRINNRVRRVLKPRIAVLELNSSNQKLRIQAANNLRKKPNDALVDVIADAIKNEKSIKIKKVLIEAKAMIDINSDTPLLRQSALDILGLSVEPEAVATVKRIAERSEAGEFLEEDVDLAQQAEQYASIIESKLSFFKVIENVIFGLSLGSILLLAAIGLAITFGVMGVINMAHGEMIMLGAYTTFAIQQIFPELIHVSLFMAIPAAFLVSGFTGVLIERVVIRHLYGRPLDTLLATFGISLILQQAVRMYNSNNVPVETPQWLSGLWELNGAIALTYNRLYIIAFSIIVLVVLSILLKKTMVGLQMRAVTQNRAMANSMGIRSGWVDALTFGLGSGIAGIAGVALSQITNVGPNLGQGYIIDSFMVVVFGGVGNLLGTFVGAMSLGVANKLIEPFAGAVIAKIIVLVFIILFIQWRPRGLFALKGRFVED